jgi:hypothetical protein
MLRRLVPFFESSGVTDHESLVTWAKAADFRRDFQGQVKGLGYAAFQWLTMRCGVETVKPDVLPLLPLSRRQPAPSSACYADVSEMTADIATREPASLLASQQVRQPVGCRDP